MIQYDILANFWLRIALSASNIYILFAVFCLWYFVQFRWFACYCLPSQTHCEKTSFIPLRYVDHSKSAKLRSKWICDSPPQIHICAACSVAQSCLTLCDPVDYSPPGSSAHRISQARILEWVAISFSRGSSQPRDQTEVSSITGIFLCLFVSIVY